MKAISQLLERALAHLLVVLMALMVLDVTWQVATRFITQNPSSFTEELARFLLMWIGLLGAAYAYRKQSHLSLDLMLQSVNYEKRMMLVRVSHVLCFAFSASVMVYGGMKLMSLTLTLDQTSAALGIPMGYVYSCLPISGLLICWFAIDSFIYPTYEIHESLSED